MFLSKDFFGISLWIDLFNINTFKSQWNTTIGNAFGNLFPATNFQWHFRYLLHFNCILTQKLIYSYQLQNYTNEKKEYTFPHHIPQKGNSKCHKKIFSCAQCHNCMTIPMLKWVEMFEMAHQKRVDLRCVVCIFWQTKTENASLPYSLQIKTLKSPKEMWENITRKHWNHSSVKERKPTNVLNLNEKWKCNFQNPLNNNNVNEKFQFNWNATLYFFLDKWKRREKKQTQLLHYYLLLMVAGRHINCPFSTCV